MGYSTKQVITFNKECENTLQIIGKYVMYGFPDRLFEWFWEMVSIISALHSTPAAVLSDPHPEVNNFAKSNICNNVKNGFV